MAGARRAGARGGEVRDGDGAEALGLGHLCIDCKWLGEEASLQSWWGADGPRKSAGRGADLPGRGMDDQFSIPFVICPSFS